MTTHSVFLTVVPHQLDLALPSCPILVPNSHIQDFTVHQMARVGPCPAGNPATTHFTTWQQRPTPVKDLSLEASAAICATKVSKRLLPPGQTPPVLSAHNVPKGNVTAENLSNTKSCEVQTDEMLNGSTAGICSPCPHVSAAVSVSSSFGGAGQESSERDLA